MKVLVARCDRLGDLVLALPVFPWLKRRRPGWEVHALVAVLNAALGNVGHAVSYLPFELPQLAMLDELVRHCRERGITNVIGRYRPTDKNAMVSRLYDELGFAKIGDEADGSTVWQLAVAGYSTQNKVIEVNP